MPSQTPTFDPALVEWVRVETEVKGNKPADLVDGNLPAEHKGVGLNDILKIAMNAKKHGWDDIKAEVAPAEAPSEDAPAKPNSKGKKATAHARRTKAPNRVNNKAANKRRRRRKGGNPMMQGRRLIADLEKFNPEFTYRWALDRPGRLASLTLHDDWEVVTDAHMFADQGGNVEAVAGRNAHNADKMILLRKPKAYHIEDQIEKMEAIDMAEQSMRKGQAPNVEPVEGEIPPVQDGNTYRPKDPAFQTQINEGALDPEAA